MTIRTTGMISGVALSTRRDRVARRRRAPALLAAAICVAVALPTAAQAQSGSTIRTVPAVPGIRIEVDGRVTETNEKGVATFTDLVRISGDAVTVLDRDVRLSPGRRARFSKLRPTDAGYVAAFDIDYRVTFDALTVGGERIDTARASRIWLRSPLTGERKSVRVGEDVWLHGKRVVAELGIVRPRDLPWTVQRFAVDGEQVVSPGQQRLVPAALPPDDRVVTVQARLFTADIAVRDALLGTATGAAVLLTHPDGDRTRHALDADGTVSIPDLIPGAYEATVTGSGPHIARPVTVSSDQQIALDVYSWWDVALVVVVAVLFFAGLAVVGRLRRTTARPVPHPVDEAGVGVSGPQVPSSPGSR